jgi:hypothetical protein
LVVVLDLLERFEEEVNDFDEELRDAGLNEYFLDLRNGGVSR